MTCVGLSIIPTKRKIEVADGTVAQCMGTAIYYRQILVPNLMHRYEKDFVISFEAHQNFNKSAGMDHGDQNTDFEDPKQTKIRKKGLLPRIYHLHDNSEILIV